MSNYIGVYLNLEILLQDFGCDGEAMFMKEGELLSMGLLWLKKRARYVHDVDCFSAVKKNKLDLMKYCIAHFFPSPHYGDEFEWYLIQYLEICH